RLVPVARLADHLDALVHGEQRREGLPEQGLVVDEQDPDGAHPGTSIVSVCPSPGADSTRSSPPSSAARSRSPTRPKPAERPSLPTPSSRTCTRTAPSP